jgi:hypothetical protein
MRTGGFDTAPGPNVSTTTVEAVMVLVIKEAYKLAALHTRHSGRVVVAPEDVFRALQVVVHPSYEFVDNLPIPTRTHNDLDGATDKDHAMSMMALEFCGRVLAAETRVNGRGQLQLADKPEYEADEETYSFAPEDVQQHDNSMFMMWKAHRLFKALVEKEEDVQRMSPMRRALVRGVQTLILKMQGSDEEDDFEDEEEEEDEDTDADVSEVQAQAQSNSATNAN